MTDERNQAAIRAGLEGVARQLAVEAVEEAAGRAREILVTRLTERLVAEAERALTAQPAGGPPGDEPEHPLPEHPVSPDQTGHPENTRAPEPAGGSDHGAGSPEAAIQERAGSPDQSTGQVQAAGVDQATGCYLFAITAAGSASPPSIQGLDGSGPVREVKSGRLAAVVCEVPLRLFDGLDQEAVGPESRLAELARRHDEVVRATFERRAVLPLRFGTVLTSEGELVGVLEAEQTPLLAELKRLEGRAEWTCRIEPDPKGAAAIAPPRPAPMGGAAYLAERERQLAVAAEADPHGVDAVAEQVSQAVEAHVESTRPYDSGGDEARISYLVRDEAQERFADAVAAVADASPAVRIELLGPHPPYHFATVQLGRDGR